MVKSIPTLKTGNEVYPSDSPLSIKFTKNGIGIVSATMQEGLNPTSFQVIDSRMSDSIYVHPAFAPTVFGTFVGNSFNNNNNIALISMGGGYVHIFNPLSNTFKTVRQATIYSAVGNSHNDRFVILGDGWWLYNSLGDVISHTNYSNVRNNCFDFTYLPGEEDRMYYINYDNKIGVFNLLDNTSVIDARVVSDCNGIVTTFDGKYIIEYQSQSLLIMEPKSFR